VRTAAERTKDELEAQTLAGGLRALPSGERLLEEADGTAPERFAAELLTALGHPTRVRIVSRLRERPMTVGQIVAELGLTQGNASQHLAILLRAGAVVRVSDGTVRRYSLRSLAVGRILDAVEEFRSRPETDQATDISD
jgi:DNA-binding transcriptional ArsR family regulator